MVDFVADDDEDQCEDEKESTAIHEEDERPTFNGGMSSIVEAKDECEPSRALQALSIEMKPSEIAKVNDYLENEQERNENIECEKRLKCEMQKPGESGGGERESKKLREKNYKHVRKKSCLLDSKANFGWALDNPLPLALGEEDKLLPTNITCLPFCVDDFVVSKIEDKEVKHRIAHVKETTFPKKDQEEQGQIDELLPRGPSTLSLFPYGVSLNCLDKLDVLKGNVNVEPILYDEYVIVDSTMKHMNVCGLDIPICLDVHNTCGLCGDWHVGLSHVLTKSGLTCYDDPFLRNSSGDKHILSFVDSCMKIGMLLLDGKMPILPLVGDYELLEHVVGESRAKSRVMFVVALNKLSMHAIDLVIHVGHKDSWIHCAYIFDHFLKLLRRDSDIFGDKLGCMHYMPSCKLKEICETPTLNVEHEFVNLWSSNSYLSKNDVSKVPYNLSLFELVNRDFVIRPLSVSFNFGHYENPFLPTPSTNKNNHSLVMKLMNLGMGSVGKMEAKGSKMFDACVFWHDLCFHCMSIKTFNGVGMFYGIFVKDFASNGFVWGYIVKEIFNLCVPISCTLSLSLVGHSNNGNWAFGLKHEHTHLFGVEPSFGAFGGQNSSCDTLIFDLDLLGFVGMLDQDLRTNPSKEGGNDVNPGVLKKNRRTGFEDKSFQKEGEDDVNPGSAKLIEGTKTSNEPLRNWGSVQTSICLLRRCPNADPRPPSSSSSKYLRMGTSHAPNGVRMREIWPSEESRAVQK